MSVMDEASPLRRQDLLGAWESSDAATSHAWSRGVIVFKPYGNDVIVEHWLPAASASTLPIRLDSLRGPCTATPFGVRLSVRSKTEQKTLDIVKVGAEMISIFLPGTSVGPQLFRRAAHPLA
jgi:hypothetical protein